MASEGVLRTMFAGSKTLTLLYLPMWMNLPGYVGGVATAFLYQYTQLEGVKLKQKKPPRWAAAVYAALDRTLVAVFFNVFLLGCISQCRSGFRSLLCWRGFHVMGRLSYCVFIVHFIVLRLTVSLLITSSVLSYIASIPLCLLVELPALQLWKAVTGEDSPRPAPAPALTPPQPASDFKPLDLLANVLMRRPDV
ncbi:Uncharacterized protein OBRU01_07346 [Operophtera brumata]|uniref:Uncharacterized protein n=1 Tax=Operophtera brumata TaxID=104452 RepID=A0A0L7LJZ1_OPEBR|nr:Uncharacterized protein OBRU01_07346 [Operophtera brumata]